MAKLADKLGFVQTSLFVRRFLFLPFFSSILLSYVIAAALNKSAMLQITMHVLLFDSSLTCEGTSANFLRFSNTSLPTYVYRMKAALNSLLFKIALNSLLFERETTSLGQTSIKRKQNGSWLLIYLKIADFTLLSLQSMFTLCPF